MTNTEFDFLHGTWNVANRRLAERLTGSREWREFPGRAQCRGFFDGNGNFDEIVFPTLGTAGATVRSYEPARKRWWIHWISSADGLLTPPVIGGFRDGVGTFYGDDVCEGTPVRCRFLWTRPTPETARWEQAFSVDGERTWETNWVMDLSR